MNKHSWVPRLVVPCIAVFGLLSIFLVIYSQWLTSRDFNENSDLIRLTQAIQHEVATAHLWFEEALGGDSSIDYKSQVHGPLLDVVQRIDVELARAGTGSTRGRCPTRASTGFRTTRSRASTA